MRKNEIYVCYQSKEEKTMVNRKTWLGMLVTVLVFGMMVVGCGDSSTNNNGKAVTKETISEKWEVKGSNSKYSSFEFTKDNVYIVTRNPSSSSNIIPQNVFLKNSDENLAISLSEIRAATSSEPPVYTGIYKIEGNKVILIGFGELTVISITDDEIIFSLKRDNSDETTEYNAGKVEDAVKESSRTEMLCRNWIVDKAYYQDYSSDYSTSATGFLFSKAGTYLVSYKNGDPQLAQWKWESDGEIYFKYSWDNWASYGIAKIEDLKATTLKIIDHPDEKDSYNDAVIWELKLAQ